MFLVSDGRLGTAPPTREAFERRERLIREYQRRARAAVRVLTEHNLTEAYLLAYRDARKGDAQ
jgi:hypothetical protein